MKFLGLFVNPFFVQGEGLQAVFDNVQTMGARAIATSTRVGVRLPDGEGVRFPDLHVDGHRRVLSRRLWGSREPLIRTSSSFEPNAGLYDGRYSPRGPVSEVDVVGSMLDEAKRRGLEFHIQMHPLLCPGLRDEDLPVLVTGGRATRENVARSACPNNPHARQYGRALLMDVLEQYRGLDGVFLDWAEFGAYRLEDFFGCFCEHCSAQAHAWGFDWERMRREVESTWNWCHALTVDELESAGRRTSSPGGVTALLLEYPGWLDLLRFKARSVAEFYREARTCMDESGFSYVQISARGWPPPWNLISGLDYSALDSACGAVTPKLFLFDYSALPRWYGETLKQWNPDLGEREIVAALLAWMDLHGPGAGERFEDYNIPAPEENHPFDLDAYVRRVEDVSNRVKGKAQCRPFAHAYLPDDQWAQLVSLIRASSVDGMWVQMYGYLSDSKMSLLGDAWKGGRSA